jgi:hypothetical protein
MYGDPGWTFSEVKKARQYWLRDWMATDNTYRLRDR